MVDGAAGSISDPEALPTAGAPRRLLDAAAELAALPAWTLAANEVYLPGEWLEAIVLTESSGRTAARRYEPHLDAAPDGDTPQTDDGDFEDDASFGPMQVLGLNVRRLLEMAPMTRASWRAALCDWMTGVGFGLRVLRAELRATNGDVARALARYNGGPTGDRVMPDGSIRRAEYVARVRSWARRVHADRARAAETRAFLGGR